MIAARLARFAPLRERALFRVMGSSDWDCKGGQVAFFRTQGKKQPVPYGDFFLRPLHSFDGVYPERS